MNTEDLKQAELRLACLNAAIEVYKLKLPHCTDLFVITGDIYTFVTTGKVEWLISYSGNKEMTFAEIAEAYISYVRNKTKP